MHSTEHTAVARVADDIFFGSVIAYADMPYARGAFPSAWVIVGRDEHVSGPDSPAFSVHQVIMPAGDEPHFINGNYDMTRSDAFKLLAEKMERDCAPSYFEPIPADKALNGGGPR